MQHHLKFADLLRLSLRTFRVKPTRAALTILGMSVGIGTVLVLVSLGYGLQYILIGRLITTEDSLITMQVSYPSETDLTIEESTAANLRALPNVAEVSPVSEFSSELRDGANSNLVIGRIIEPDYFRLSGALPDLGGMIKQPGDGLIATAAVLKLLGASSTPPLPKRRLTLAAYYYGGDGGFVNDIATTSPLPIVGAYTDESEPPVVYALSDALSKKPSQFQEVLVKASDIDHVEAVRDELTARGFDVSARFDLVKQAQKVTNIITGVLAVFGVTALVVSAIGMFNTMLVGFLERIYEVGILKSIGATDRDIRNLFLVESSMMGFLGGLGGVLLGIVLSRLLNLLVSFAAMRLGGHAFDLFLTPLWFIGLILVISLGIGFMAGFWPAMRAMRLSPKEAFMRK